MAVSSQQVSLNTSSASLLAECTEEPAIVVALQSPGTQGQSVYLGASTLAASTDGYELGETALQLTLAPGDSLYAIASTGTPTVQVLTWGANS